MIRAPSFQQALRTLRACGPIVLTGLIGVVAALSPALITPAAAASTSASAPAAAAPLAVAAPQYRFSSEAREADWRDSLVVLSPEERAFIARLPEIRVAVPLPAAQPYEYIGADGLITGIHPEMLMALSRIFGLRVRPVVLPDWPSMLKAAQAREVDLIMSIGVTPARLDYLAFTLGTSPLPGGVFTRRGGPVDLARARYAVERDFVAQDWLHRQYPDAPLLVVDSTAAALEAVALGRADAYMGSLLAASDLLARRPQPGVELHRIVSYGSGHYHFAVRKDWEPLVGILNKGIHRLRGTGSGVPSSAALIPGADQCPALLNLSPTEVQVLSARSVWRVGAVRSLPLLNEITDRGTHSGIAAEYTEQLVRRLGIGVEVVPFDSVAAMLDGMRKGQIDVVPFLTRTRAREAEFTFSTPYVEMPYVLVGRADGPLYWDLNSLRGKSLALTAQHPLQELVTTSYPDIRIVQAPPGFGAMDMVLRGQADAAVEVKLFANLRINGTGGEGLRTLSEVNELPAQFHFAVRSDAPILLSLINRGLADIAPAERERMLRRWVAVDLQPRFPWRRYAPLIGVIVAAVLGFAVVTLLWMKRLQREVKARRRSEQLLHDIAATMPGVAFRYVLAADGRLLHHYFTAGAQALLGRDLDPHATVLDSLSDRGDPAEIAEGRAVQARSARTGEPFEYTGRYHHPDGRTRWLRVHAVRSLGNADRSTWTGYIVDLSSERELQEKLAREAQSRNLLLASASHELRAPTHTLSLALQSVPREGLALPQARALQIAEDSANTLSELLNDVLEAARTGHEALQLRPRSFDLVHLLEDLGRAWRTAARNKGLEFELALADGLPRTLVSDPLRLKQVLINLLSNACKYTATGQVSLAARLDADGALQISVTDTGPGIGEAAQARLFKPYVTLNEASETPLPEGSTGLGLASCRRMAELLGGRLELNSTPGQGTQVHLTLPLPKAAAAKVIPPGWVLVCDDDEVSRILLGEMLRSTGLQVADTGECEVALAQWRSGSVRALITDLDLPGMNGMALMQAIREDEAAHGDGRRSCIVVCSGSPVPVAEAGQGTAAYDAWLVKPVVLSTLTDTLTRLGVVPDRGEPARTSSRR